MNVSLKAPWTKSAAWARILANGDLELELFDFSPEAEDHLGGDVAWFYTVSASRRAELVRLLEASSGQPIQGDSALLNVLATEFEHIHAIRDWLREKAIPFEERFDSQA